MFLSSTKKGTRHHEKTGEVDVEIILKTIAPPLPNHDFTFFITCPLLDLERKKNEEKKNAGTLLINKAALLSGEVEQVCFYPQGHSSDFRSSRVVNLEAFCEGNRADLKKK